MAGLLAFFLGAYAALLLALWRLRNRQAPEGAVVGYALLMLMGGVLGVLAWAFLR
jgi:hypothetical protein